MKSSKWSLAKVNIVDAVIHDDERDHLGSVVTKRIPIDAAVREDNEEIPEVVGEVPNVDGPDIVADTPSVVVDGPKVDDPDVVTVGSAR